MLLLPLCETQRHLSSLAALVWEEPSVLWLSCKEITIATGTDSFTARNAKEVRSYWLPVVGLAYLCFHRAQNCQDIKKRGTAQVGCIKLKKGRKLGLPVGQITHLLAVGYLLCELPLPCISSSWTGESSLEVKETSASRSKSRGVANQGVW